MDRSVISFRPDVRRWGYAGEFILRRCCGCGLVFNSPKLTADQLKQLYGPDYYFFERSTGAELARIQGAYLRTIAHLPSTEPRTLLDVGSAKGYMLAILVRLGWRVVGVEIASSAARYSRRTFGLEVFTGTLEEFRREDDRQFDVVLAQDVLEHVPDPRGFRDALCNSIRPGGWLIIDTPNVGGRNVDVLGERWRGFNPFHLYLFDRSTLGRTLTEAGLDILSIASYNNVAPECSVAPNPDALAFPFGKRASGWARAGVWARELWLKLDQALLPYYLKRAERAVLRGKPVPLSTNCEGDNLVCLAQRPG